MDPNSMTARLTFKQAGLATLGLDAAWDRAVQRYLRCETLYYAADAFGRGWKAQPEAARRHDISFKGLIKAEEDHVRQFAEPYWRAANELALTPAPSLAAAMFKAAVMEHDEIDTSRDFPAKCMEVLQADFARLSREAAS